MNYFFFHVDINNVIEKVVNSWIILLQYYPLELDTVKTSCEVMIMLITRPTTKYLNPVLTYPAIQYLLSQYTGWYQYVYTFYTTCYTSTGNGIYGGSLHSAHSQSILPGLTPEGWMMITEVLSRIFIQTKQTNYFRSVSPIHLCIIFVFAKFSFTVNSFVKRFTRWWK